MNIESLIKEVTEKYHLTKKEQEKILDIYKDDKRSIVSLEVEINSLADYYNWQNKVEKAINEAPPLQPNQNYYIRTYDEKSNIILQGVNIEKISDTTSGVNKVEKVLIDNKYKAYKKKDIVDVADNDLEIVICQIGNLLNVSGAEEYTVYNANKEKDSIISRSVADTEYEEFYDFTSLYIKVNKYIKEGKIKHSKVSDYEEFKFSNSKEDYIKVIEKSIQIIRSLPMISQKDIRSIKAAYFDMMIFGYITNQVDRNLNNYGLICNKKTKEYRFAPLFDNSIISLPNLDETQCSFNGYICSRNKLIDCLFENYYEDIKEKVTYLGKDGITGAPSKFEYSVKALKDGTTDLTFVYKRPFEADKALDTIVYKIEVKNGEILAQGTIEGKWRINSFYKNDEAQAICDVVLNLKKEKDDFFVSGEAGVNIFNGNIKLSENIGNGEGGFAMTRMMGPADAMSFEHEYIQLFNGEFYVIPAVKNGTEILTIANLKNGLSAEYRLVKEPLVERQ